MRSHKQSSKHAGLWALTALMATMAFAGCISDPGGSSSLYVKDALTDDVDAVHVTFTKAQVMPEGGGWDTVYEGRQTIELLSLSAADAKEQLDSFDLAPGNYDGLRIAVSEVEITHKDGTTELLNVFGNVVAISDEFTVGAEGIDILVDFDLEAGVDLEAGTYTPVVKNVQTSADDADGDGLSDFEDTDDDDDGRDDAEDDDIDGDGDDDRPDQEYVTLEEMCGAERDDEIAEAHEEHAEELEDAQEDYDEVMNDPESSEEERAEAQAEYDEEVAEADEELQEELAEIEEEHQECLTGDEDEDDDSEEEDDESDEDDI